MIPAIFFNLHSFFYQLKVKLDVFQNPTELRYLLVSSSTLLYLLLPSSSSVRIT